MLPRHLVATSAAVVARAARTITVTTHRAAALMALPVVALTVVALVVVLAAVLLAVVTTVALQPVAMVAASAAVTTVVLTVVLRLAATAKDMAASQVLAMRAVAASLPVAMQAHRVVISRRASLRSPSLRVVVASPLWPTMRASALRAPHADR